MDIEKKIVIVIGNGFDLDIGWNTTYKAFMESMDFWPFHKEAHGLGAWLNIQAHYDNWYDLEKMLRTYACLIQDRSLLFDVETDKSHFAILKYRIGDYLQTESTRAIRRTSMACSLLHWLAKNRNVKIYSFNYTNLQNILDSLKIEENIPCEYIHGSLASQTQILGIDDHAEVREGYHFLLKTFQPSYRSHNMLDDMRDAYCVIFYGLCMGEIDYPYFKLFFQERCSEELYKEKRNKKYICFFTKDENSVIDIKRNLLSMNDGKLMQMFCYNKMAFFTTEGKIWSQEYLELDHYFYNLNLNLSMV